MQKIMYFKDFTPSRKNHHILHFIVYSASFYHALCLCLPTAVFSLLEYQPHEKQRTVHSPYNAQVGTPSTPQTASNFSVFLMQVETGYDKETGERQGKKCIICCQEKRLFSLPRFYFLHC